MKKYFCIGLHKTGTSSLHRIAKLSGLKAIHSTDWAEDTDKISKYDFFCDGGSHYEGINEFNYESLWETYGDAHFILSIRDVKSWVISKCKHAGWNMTTKVETSLDHPKHQMWTHKSYDNIRRFIEHYYSYYMRVLTFFMDKKKSLTVVNIVEEKNIDKLLDKIGISLNVLPHENKSKSKGSLKKPVLLFIDRVLMQMKSQQKMLDVLLENIEK